MDCSLPGSSIHGIVQARVLEWVAISFSRGSSRPRNRTQVFHIAGRCFNLWATRGANWYPQRAGTCSLSVSLWQLWDWSPDLTFLNCPGLCLACHLSLLASSSPHAPLYGGGFLCVSLGSLVILWAYPDLRFTLLGRELLQQIGMELPGFSWRIFQPMEPCFFSVWVVRHLILKLKGIQTIPYSFHASSWGKS